jgi:formylglycine-generating enzyme required for sulfatase activity
MSRGLAVIAGAVLSLVAVVGPSIAQDAKPWQKPGTKVGDEIIGPDGGKLVWVPAGEFIMGSTQADVDSVVNKLNVSARWLSDEKPAHRVRITRGFWLGKCTVTNAQYRQYCQDTRVTFPKKSDQGDNHPVEYVSWNDAVAYCKQYGLNLPTEAQWEYAARGSENRIYPWSNEWDPKKCCNKQNKGLGGQTFPVGSFPEGASWCGALDMAGNVFQWCTDWYSGGYYAKSPDTDPPGPDKGDHIPGLGPCRALRGGSWRDGASYCRCAYRDCYDPAYRYGFRYSFTP